MTATFRKRWPCFEIRLLPLEEGISYDLCDKNWHFIFKISNHLYVCIQPAIIQGLNIHEHNQRLIIKLKTFPVSAEIPAYCTKTGFWLWASLFSISFLWKKRSTSKATIRLKVSGGSTSWQLFPSRISGSTVVEFSRKYRIAFWRNPTTTLWTTTLYCVWKSK